MFRMKVKELATARKLSQAKLGRLADLSPKTLQEIYRDPYRDVAYSTLLKIARALGVTVDDLIEDVPEEKGEGN